MVGHHPARVDDGGVKGIVARIVGAQLVTDRLLDLNRHTPGMDEFGADFRKITSEIGLLDFRQRFPKLPASINARLRPFGNRLVQHQVPMSREQPFDEKPLAVFDAAGFGNLARHQCETLFRQ